MTTGREKRRTAKAKRIAQRRAKEHETITSSIPIKTKATQDYHEKEANNHAEQKAQEKGNNNSGTGETRYMSGFVLTIMSLICAALVAIAFGYWFKGGYENAKIGFYWLVAACVVFGIVVLSAYWYY